MGKVTYVAQRPDPLYFLWIDTFNYSTHNGDKEKRRLVCAELEKTLNCRVLSAEFGRYVSGGAILYEFESEELLTMALLKYATRWIGISHSDL